MIWCICLTILAAPYSEEDQENVRQYVEKYELTRKVRDMAIEAGLGKKDANELTVDLGGSPAFPPLRKFVEYWKKKEGFDLFPFLEGVAEMEGLPFQRPPSPPANAGLSLRTTLNWIAVCKEPQSSEWLLRYVQARMEEPIKTEQEARRIKDIVRTLGYDGKDTAVDFLFRLQSKKAWEHTPPVAIEIEGLSPEAIRLEAYHIRSAAVAGIAFSGSDRALRAFATGKGLADDVVGLPESYFDTAAHARFGMYALDWHYRKGLEPEVEAALRAIYEKYGMEYKGKEMYGLDCPDNPT